jgi:outer membrane protein assembly factor BamA
MSDRAGLSLLFVCLLTAGELPAQCAKGQDHRARHSGGIQIVDMEISGTQTLSSGDLSSLEGTMVDGCYDDDSDEIEERVRALFQDRGYFRIEVQSLDIIATDPLKTPKPVKVEAVVTEGEIFRLKEITFTGNHHFGDEELRKAFPIKANDLFARARIAGGLESMRGLYNAQGYLDMVMIPSTTFAGSGVNLTVEVREGPQYHLGKLEVFAKKESADRLSTAWELGEGKVYDAGYVDKFLQEHEELLPEGFSRSNVQIVKDCPDRTVDVRFIVDPVRAAAHPAKPVPCEKTEP